MLLYQFFKHHNGVHSSVRINQTQKGLGKQQLQNTQGLVMLMRKHPLLRRVYFLGNAMYLQVTSPDSDRTTRVQVWHSIQFLIMIVKLPVFWIYLSFNRLFHRWGSGGWKCVYPFNSVTKPMISKWLQALKYFPDYVGWNDALLLNSIYLLILKICCI